MNQQPGVLVRVFRMFGGRAGLYITVAALPYLVLFALFFYSFQIAKWPVDYTGQSDPTVLWNSLGWGRKVSFMLGVVLAAWAPLFVAGRGLCRVAADQHMNRVTSFGRVLAEMAAFVPVAMLYALAAGFLSLFCSLPGLLAAVTVSLFIAAAAAEQLGPLAAMRRGFSLLSRALGRMILLFLGYFVLFFLFLVLNAVLMSFLPDIPTARFVSLGILFVVLLFPLALLYICVTLLYYDARDRAAPASAPASDAAAGAS